MINTRTGGVLWLVLALGLPGAVGGAQQPSPSRQAETMSGRVDRVIDGDAIHVLAGATSVTVRLDGIDAPESGQAFGTQARQALAAKILGQTVSVQPTGKDKYGRVLGVVWLGKRNINLEMVAEGWAWQFKKYSSDKTLAAAEAAARGKGAGLWADAHPQAPWDWRTEEKQRRKETGVARPTEDPSVPPPSKQSLKNGSPKKQTTREPVAPLPPTADRGGAFFEPKGSRSGAARPISAAGR